MDDQDNPISFFFQNETTRGSAPLEELVQGFESTPPSFFRDTWIRTPESLHWSQLEYTKEVAYALHWDFIKGKNKRCKVKGSDLLILFERKSIKPNTYVKLSFGEEWKKYKETVLFQSQHTKNHALHGIFACPPGWKNMNARVIDILSYSLLPTAVMWFFNPMISMILFFAEIFFAIPSSLLQARHMSRSGRTLGMKMAGLYILTAQGDKLSFSQAFSRQGTLNPFEGNKFKFFRMRKRLTPYGAVQWDRDNGCIVTDHLPHERSLP